MFRRMPRGFLTLLAITLSTIFIVPIIQQNVEEWSKKRGYDQYMVKYWGPVVDWLASFTQTSWFIFVMGFVIGGSVFLWADWFLRSRQQNGESPSETGTNEEKTKISEVRNIKSAKVVQSGENKFALVISPLRGGVDLEIYLKWSPFLLTGWAVPQKFFIGQLRLRSADIKDSIEILEHVKIAQPSTLADLGGFWSWKILKADGTAQTTQPISNGTKERVTFEFIDGNGNKEQFDFLLVRRRDDLISSPIFVSPDEMPNGAL